MHSTFNIDDGYMGSGKRIIYSINKHGIENHRKEILEFLTDRKSLVKREEELITEDILNNPQCMNIRPGGNFSGGFIDNEHQLKCSSAGGKANSEKIKNDEEHSKRFRDKTREITVSLKKGFLSNPLDWTGRKHSIETIEKMKKSHQNQGISDKNSQFGTCWITNGIKSIKIKKSEPVPEGWQLGRKIKYVPLYE